MPLGGGNGWKLPAKPNGAEMKAGSEGVTHRNGAL